MTYIYYKSSAYTTEPKISEKQIDKCRKQSVTRFRAQGDICDVCVTLA